MLDKNKEKKDIKNFIDIMYYRNNEVENYIKILSQLKNLKESIDINYEKIIADIHNKIETIDKNNKETENKNFEKVFKELTADERKLLYYRHHDRLSWLAISDKMNYSNRNLYYMYRSALKKVREVRNDIKEEK